MASTSSLVFPWIYYLAMDIFDVNKIVCLHYNTNEYKHNNTKKTERKQKTNPKKKQLKISKSREKLLEKKIKIIISKIF